MGVSIYPDACIRRLHAGGAADPPSRRTFSGQAASMLLKAVSPRDSIVASPYSKTNNGRGEAEENPSKTNKGSSSSRGQVPFSPSVCARACSSWSQQTKSATVYSPSGETKIKGQISLPPAPSPLGLRGTVDQQMYSRNTLPSF